MKPLAYYARRSPFTDPGEHADRLNALPDDLESLSRVVRGLVIHYRLGHLFDYRIPDDRLPEVDTRYAEKMLARIVELDDRPLTEERPPERRLVGCCRDFAVLFLTMARHKGIPARARVGFADYFEPDFDVDHEVAEVWDAEGGRWRLVDPELGDALIEAGGIGFDPTDVPRDRFIDGGAAWQACREGLTDPETFVVDPGLEVEATRGWPYLRHNLLHDLAALNKRELLLWDSWGMIEREPSPEESALLDGVAALTQAADGSFRDLRAAYGENPGLEPHPTVTSYSPAAEAPLEVRLAP